MKLFHVIITLLLVLGTQAFAAFDHSHQKFEVLLSKVVIGNSVKYKSLKKEPNQLGIYLSDLSKVTRPEFNSWSKKQQLAYLINLYNAGTLKLITDHYPMKSIRDLKRPWKQKRIKLFGKNVSLDHIEHDILRKKYSEPRIHFAVNCASIGCPPLRAEPFQAKKLEQQLEEQTKAFLQDSSKNHLDRKKGALYLSSIFKWFKKDFTKKSGTLEKFVAPYFSEKDAKSILSGNFKVKYFDYNWKLNHAK